MVVELIRCWRRNPSSRYAANGALETPIMDSGPPPLPADVSALFWPPFLWKRGGAFTKFFTQNTFLDDQRTAAGRL